MKRILFLLIFIPVVVIGNLVFAEPLQSPTWGFKIDLPEAYEFAEGDAKNRFSFSGPGGAMFDLVVYNGAFPGIRELVDDVNKRLSNKGDIDFFEYNDKQAAVIELNFGSFSGWGLCVELVSENGGAKPMLLALAYGPAANNDLLIFHFSSLDSIIPSKDEIHYPGPISEYSFPRGEKKRVSLASGKGNAIVHENDAEAAQVLVEREFKLLTNYLATANLQEAWRRYYRLIYRDSFDRITDAVSVITRGLGGAPSTDEAKRAFAQKALAFVQGFKYERNNEGSDFVNLVTAVTEGRGDCDSRTLLWASILTNAGINAAMMVSPVHSHAMGLADVPGYGARFETYGLKWLVAETTANIDIGLINQEFNDPSTWLGIVFE